MTNIPSEPEFSFGTVGHTSMHHAVRGKWQGPWDQSALPQAERLNAPACNPRKRCGRAIKKPDAFKLCGQCKEILAGDTPVAISPSPQQLPLSGDFQPEYESALVPLGELFVDPAIQRPMQEPWSKKISRNFSPSRFADHPPKVSLRSPERRGPNGEMYHVMDGQHEIDAARRAGYPPQTLVPVHVYHGVTDAQQEATKFLEVNEDRKVVKAISRFPIAVRAGEPRAVALQEALEHYGWRSDSSGSEGGIACVVTLQNLAANPDRLDKVLQTITGAWGIRNGIQQPVIGGLGLIYGRPRSEGKPCKVDVQHMIRRLKTVAPESVIAAGKSSFGGSTSSARSANYIIGEYNKFLRSTPKLDLFP